MENRLGKYIGRGIFIVGVTLLPACAQTPQTEVQRSSEGDKSYIVEIKNYNPRYHLQQLSKNIVRVNMWDTSNLNVGLNVVNDKCEIKSLSDSSVGYYIVTKEDFCLDKVEFSNIPTPTPTER